MPRYTVTLTADAYMAASVDIEATSEADARAKALERIGDVSWRYQGTIDGTEEIEEITCA